MSASKLDAVYRSILLTKFFTKGWGKPENLRRLFEFRKVVSNRDECFKLIERDYPVTITKEQNLADCKLIEGYFMTPLERYLPGIVPEVAQKAHFQAILPNHWPQPDCKPVCLHLAGTGDHFFWRRRNLMVKPLIREASIGGIILENPFYGLRKPVDQVRSSLHNVSDIFVMGGCLILESLVLFHWCERHGLGPLGVTGLSMGGHMASLAATNWPKPLVLVPCLSWSTASAVFLQGVMSQSINWDLLEDQYLSDGLYKDKLSKMVTIVDEAFLAGKKFARTYSHTVYSSAAATVQTDNKTDDKNLDITYYESSDARYPGTEKKDCILDTNIPNEAKETESTQPTEETKATDPIQSTDANVADPVQPIEAKATEPIHPEATKEAPTMTEFNINMYYFNDELKKLLNDGKISMALFEKFTSNEKFELESEDIECINKLNEGSLKDLLLMYRGVETRGKEQHKTTINSTQINDKLTKDDKTRSSKTIDITKKSTEELKEHKTQSIDFTTKSGADVITADQSKSLANHQKEKKSWVVSDIASDWLNLPFKKSGKKINISKIHWRDREALQFMRGIMDECTHLSNFSVPYDTSLIIAVCAKHDAYVPRVDVGTLEEIWPGAEVRYVDAGHVSAYILHQSLFRSCIREAFERSKSKWKDGKHID